MTSAGDEWMREIERRQGYDAMARDEEYGPMKTDTSKEVAMPFRPRGDTMTNYIKTDEVKFNTLATMQNQWEVRFGNKDLGTGLVMHLSQVGDTPVAHPNRFQRWMLSKFFGMHWIRTQENSHD